MSYRNHLASFEPEALAALQRAFDRSWGELQLEGLGITHSISARQVLAERLIAYAQKGHTDPLELQKLAIRSLRPIRRDGQEAAPARKRRSLPSGL